MKEIVVGVLILLIFGTYFQRQKYINLPEEDTETFKNVKIYKFNENI
jgi:hypothetical protein